MTFDEFVANCDVEVGRALRTRDVPPSFECQNLVLRQIVDAEGFGYAPQAWKRGDHYILGYFVQGASSPLAYATLFEQYPIASADLGDESIAGLARRLTEAAHTYEPVARRNLYRNES